MKLEIDLDKETPASLSNLVKFLSKHRDLRTTKQNTRASKVTEAPDHDNGASESDEDVDADFSDKSMRSFVHGLGNANRNGLQAIVDNGGRLGYDDMCTASERNDMRGAGGIVRRAKRILKHALLIWDEKREEYFIPKEAVKPLKEALDYHQGE